MRVKRKIKQPNFIVKYCVYCNARFYANRNTAKYCSDTCKVYAYEERQEFKMNELEDLPKNKMNKVGQIKNFKDSKNEKNLIAIMNQKINEQNEIKSPNDTEQDFIKLIEQLNAVVENEDPDNFLSRLKREEKINSKISDYEKRFNTTFEYSKKRFPNALP